MLLSLSQSVCKLRVFTISQLEPVVTGLSGANRVRKENILNALRVSRAYFIADLDTNQSVGNSSGSIFQREETLLFIAFPFPFCSNDSRKRIAITSVYIPQS